MSSAIYRENARQNKFFLCPDASPAFDGRRVAKPYLLTIEFGNALFDFLICPRCSSKMRVIASLTDPDSIHTYLTGVGAWQVPPERAPARAPPQMPFDDFNQDDEFTSVA